MKLTMKYRFWILIIKNQEIYVSMEGFKIFFKNIMARRLHVYVTLNQLLFTCKMQEHFIKALSF